MVPAGTLGAEGAFPCDATLSQSHIKAGTRRRGRDLLPHIRATGSCSPVPSLEHPQTQFWGADSQSQAALRVAQPILT